MKKIDGFVFLILTMFTTSIVMGDSLPTNIMYYSQYHQYLKGKDDHIFHNKQKGFDCTSDIKDFVNFMYLSGNYVSGFDNKPEYQFDNLAIRFLDNYKKSVVFVVPYLFGNYPGTSTPIIESSYWSDQNAIIKFNGLNNEIIEDYQRTRFELLWTGWESVDGDCVRNLLTGEIIADPSTIPDSEFLENESFTGLIAHIEDFYEHITFIDFLDEPYNRFPIPDVDPEYNDCRGWLYEIVDSVNRIGNENPDTCFYLTQIPKRVNLNTENLLGKTYNLGNETDLIPDNIDVVQTDPYFPFILRICHDSTFRASIDEAFYQHNFCGSGLNLSQEHHDYKEWNLSYGSAPPNNKGWETSQWLNGHTRTPNDPFMCQKFINHFLKVLNISYTIIDHYAKPGAGFGIFAHSVGDLDNSTGHFYRKEGQNHIPNKVPNSDISYIDWYYYYSCENDRMISLDYYKAGPVVQFERYGMNSVIRDLLLYLSAGSTIDVNNYFMLAEENGGGYCNPDGFPVGYADEIDLEKLDWFIINTQRTFEINEIRINPSPGKIEFIDVICDHENNFTAWELCVCAYWNELSQQANSNNDKKYLFDNFNHFISHFMWLITESNPDFDFITCKPGDSFPVISADTEFHRIFRYFYYLICQYRYVDCSNASGESLSFWVDSYPIEPNSDAFGTCDFPDQLLQPISQRMDEIKNHHIDITPKWRYLADYNRIQLGFRAFNPAQTINVTPYVRFWKVINGRLVDAENVEYVLRDSELPCSSNLKIFGNGITGSYSFWQIDDLEPLAPSDSYCYRFAIRLPGEPEYLVGTGSQKIITETVPGHVHLMVKDSVVEETIPHELIDINGDGFDDIVGVFEDQCVFLINGQDGEFYNLGHYIGQNVNKLSVGDINNDGIKDLSIATSEYISSYIGQPDLSYRFDEVIFSLSTENDAKIVDLDKDGNNEFIPTSSFTSLEFADIDCDNDLDVVFSETDGLTSLYLNDGDGNFNDSLQNLGAGDATMMAIKDLNNDLYPEIFLGRYGGYDTLLINLGDGKYIQSEIQFNTIHTNDACISDFNNDGLNDLIIATDSSEENVLLINDPEEHFNFVRISLGDTLMEKVFCKDVNLDGIMDVIAGEEGKLVIK